MNIIEEIQIGGKSLSLATGQVAKQANGSVMIRYGDTVVLVTACGQREPREGITFLPLTVDYREYTFSAGKIPGGFFRREGRPSESEILVSRMIDRPLRPLFPEGYNFETQVIASVLSYDVINKPDILGIIGASAALCFSEVPFTTPLGAVRIGRLNGQFVVNPTNDEIENSTLDLIAVSSEKAILMVEAGANEESEEVVLEALELAWKEAQPIIEMQKKIAASLKVKKWDYEKIVIPEEITKKVKETVEGQLLETLTIAEKKARSLKFDEMRESVVEEYPEEGDDRIYAKMAFDTIKQNSFRENIFKDKKRFDGRAFDEIRDVSCLVQFLPRTHGSALFTRGETQALVTTTLGARSDAQIMDELEGEWKRRFILHYNFPPFSVGEVKFLRGASRREIGHGALAHRALAPVLPSEEEFPYTLRIFSDILESNGSSSMATVCGGSLALFDGGVPVRAAVAGIAMGLLKEGDDVIILSDIAGEEDHYGDMDFKVAGTRNGITALQMDIKIHGVTTELLRQALEQAKQGRFHILDVMDGSISEPRPDLSPYAPRIVTIKIDVEKIRDVIGTGGKIIRKIVEESKAEIDIEDDGTILIYSPDKAALEAAKRMIEEIVEEPEVGKTYVGKVVSIVDFGAFIQILPSVQGLLHISEIANYRVNQVSDELRLGDEVVVKVIEYDKLNGKVRLSRRAALQEKEGSAPGEGSRGGRGGGQSRPPRDSRPRGRRGPQHGGAPIGGRQDGSRGSTGRRRSSRSGPGYGNGDNRQKSGRKDSGYEGSSGFRFPGNLGPDPHDPGGKRGGGGKRW